MHGQIIWLIARGLEAEQTARETPGMTLKFDDDTITSPDTHHKAVRINARHWKITWLTEDFRLDRNQAISAMTIAAVVGATDKKITRADPIWAHVNSWAAELGLEGASAINWASRPVRWEVQTNG
jgi:hypothetical protein